MSDKKRIIVGVSGASGFVLAADFLRALRKNGEAEIHLVVTRGAEMTMAEEINLMEHTSTGTSPINELADKVYNIEDVGAAIASGTFRTMGMVVIPCSMKTVAGINSGYSDNLLLRAADVTLKERRKLVLIVRETPLSPIHLKNMLELSQMGAVILPAVMSFYNSMSTAEEMKRHLIGKIFDQFELEYPEFKRWGDPDCSL